MVLISVLVWIIFRVFPYGRSLRPGVEGLFPVVPKSVGVAVMVAGLSLGGGWEGAFVFVM